MYADIRGGSPGRGVKRQWGCRKRQYSAFALNILCVRHRLHYASYLSVSLSVCPVQVVTWKNVEKSKLVQTFPRAGVSGVPMFRWKGQRSRSSDVKNHIKLVSYSLTGDRSSADGSGANRKLGLCHC